jgi:hypothetical protein
MDRADSQPPKAGKSGPPASERVDSWKEIARYLNRDVWTVQRREETGRLPVYRRTPERLKGLKLGIGESFSWQNLAGYKAAKARVLAL